MTVAATGPIAVVVVGVAALGCGRLEYEVVTASRDAETPDAGPETGLRGEYGLRVCDVLVARIDPTIDFDWGAGSPDPLVPADGFFVRWTGTIDPPTTERYTFAAVTNDGVHLAVDGVTLIDEWHGSESVRYEGSIDLVAGRPTPIVVAVYEVALTSEAHVFWSTPTIAEEILPTARLAPPSDPPPPPGTLYDPGTTTATEGLRGEYFADEALSVPAGTRIDATIDFDWGPGTPIHCVADFSVRWTGTVTPTTTETYTFHAFTNDGVRLFVDDVLVVDDWTVRDDIVRTADVALEAGRPHAIRLEYFQHGRTARARLSWSSEAIPEEVVPAARLRPP